MSSWKELLDIVQLRSNYGYGEAFPRYNLTYLDRETVLSGTVLEDSDFCVTIIGKMDVQHAHFTLTFPRVSVYQLNYLLFLDSPLV